MKHHEIETRLYREFTADAPSVISEDILEAFDNNAHKTASPAVKTVIPWRRIVAFAASFAVLLTAGAMLFLKNRPSDTMPPVVPQTQTQSHAITADKPSAAAFSTVTLDVNPSINLEVDESETVVSVTAFNEDGQTVIGDLQLEGLSLDDAVSLIIESMIEHGYITDLANSVLVSVDSENSEEAIRLRQKLADKVIALLEDLDGAILSQTIVLNDNTKALATEHGISNGKAMLIARIMELDPLKTFDALAPLNINDLNLIVRRLALPDVATAGKASDKAYIGEENAIAAALLAVEIDQTAVTALRCEMDYEDGKMCYEIEFVYNGTEYEIEIDAQTGELMDMEQETAEDDDDDHDYNDVDRDDDLDDDHDDDDDRYDDDDHYDDDDDDDDRYDDDDKEYIDDDRHDAPVADGTVLSEEDIKVIALEHVGVTADAVTRFKCKLDRDDGRTIYEAELISGSVCYELEIDAQTGDILDSETDSADDDDEDDD